MQLTCSRMANSAHSLISGRILALLKERGMTQAKLAELADMKAGYLSELISGKNGKRWNTDIVDQIAAALGIDAKYIMTDDDMKAEEIKLLAKYRTLDPEQQKTLEHLLDMVKK